LRPFRSIKLVPRSQRKLVKDKDERKI
jgi:hypothetical protein